MVARLRVPDWFRYQLGFDYKGLSNLPENFVYNTGNEHPLRRLVSVFLSPLATSYMLVVALLLATTWRLRLRAPLRVWLPTTALLAAGLLWTHSRSSYLALAVGLVVFAIVRPQWRVGLVAAAVLVVVVGLAFVKVYPHIAPSTTFTAQELKEQRQHAHTAGAGPAVSGFEDASTSSHLRSLRDGIKSVVEHPQGFGPGNAGSTASRTNVTVEAGESTYTQVGADVGLAGGVLFAAWCLALLWRVTALHRLARGRARSDARARPADRHPRRAVDRLPAVAARRLARLAPPDLTAGGAASRGSGAARRARLWCTPRIYPGRGVPTLCRARTDT